MRENEVTLLRAAVNNEGEKMKPSRPSDHLEPGIAGWLFSPIRWLGLRTSAPSPLQDHNKKADITNPLQNLDKELKFHVHMVKSKMVYSVKERLEKIILMENHAIDAATPLIQNLLTFIIHPYRSLQDKHVFLSKVTEQIILVTEKWTSVDLIELESLHCEVEKQIVAQNKILNEIYSVVAKENEAALNSKTPLLNINDIITELKEDINREITLSENKIGSKLLLPIIDNILSQLEECNIYVSQGKLPPYAPEFKLLPPFNSFTQSLLKSVKCDDKPTMELLRLVFEEIEEVNKSYKHHLNLLRDDPLYRKSAEAVFPHKLEVSTFEEILRQAIKDDITEDFIFRDSPFLDLALTAASPSLAIPSSYRMMESILTSSNNFTVLLPRAAYLIKIDLERNLESTLVNLSKSKGKIAQLVSKLLDSVLIFINSKDPYEKKVPYFKACDKMMGEIHDLVSEFKKDYVSLQSHIVDNSSLLKQIFLRIFTENKSAGKTVIDIDETMAGLVAYIKESYTAAIKEQSSGRNDPNHPKKLIAYVIEKVAKRIEECSLVIKSNKEPNVFPHFSTFPKITPYPTLKADNNKINMLGMKILKHIIKEIETANIVSRHEQQGNNSSAAAAGDGTIYVPKSKFLPSFESIFQEELTRELYKASADPKDIGWLKQLHWAGAKINPVLADSYQTALMEALAHENVEAAVFLIECGADLTPVKEFLQGKANLAAAFSPPSWGMEEIEIIIPGDSIALNQVLADRSSDEVTTPSEFTDYSE
jgi:hypothetical protein